MESDLDNSRLSRSRNFVRREKSRPRFDQNRFEKQKAQIKKPTVLIFEPNEQSRDALCSFLKKNGYRTLSIQRPESVEFQFETWPRPDLLIISAHQQLKTAVKTFNTLLQIRTL